MLVVDMVLPCDSIFGVVRRPAVLINTLGLKAAGINKTREKEMGH
jgi:hypothetical protein